MSLLFASLHFCFKPQHLTLTEPYILFTVYNSKHVSGLFKAANNTWLIRLSGSSHNLIVGVNVCCTLLQRRHICEARSVSLFFFLIQAKRLEKLQKAVEWKHIKVVDLWPKKKKKKNRTQPHSTQLQGSRRLSEEALPVYYRGGKNEICLFFH